MKQKPPGQPRQLMSGRSGCGAWTQNLAKSVDEGRGFLGVANVYPRSMPWLPWPLFGVSPTEYFELQAQIELSAIGTWRLPNYVGKPSRATQDICAEVNRTTSQALGHRGVDRSDGGDLR